MVFATVIVTVTLYGLTATRVARATRVAKTEPTGVALVSNHRFIIELADELVANNVAVLVVSSSTEVQREALSRGLFAYDRALDNHDLDLTLDGVGIKRAVIITDDENFASLANHHLSEHLGRANMFQVQPDEDDDDFEMRGRAAFGNVKFRELTMTARSGGFVTREPGDRRDGERQLFHIADNGTVSVLTGASSASTGQVLVVTQDAERKRRSADHA